MMTHSARSTGSIGTPIQARGRQQGITTLAVTLLLLGIVTIFLLFSANVSFFDQRTATAENRALAAEQMAEYAANLGGEFLNANRSVVANTSASDGGWLASSGSSRRWLRCPAGAGPSVNMPSRILIVDDEPNILGTVAPLLRSRGYEVFSAMSGMSRNSSRSSGTPGTSSRPWSVWSTGVSQWRANEKRVRGSSGR